MLNALKTFNVLDKTVIVWVSEITEGHNQINMVTVVAGGQSLGLKMGQYIKYPITGEEPEGSGAIPVQQNPKNKGLNDLWVTAPERRRRERHDVRRPEVLHGRGLAELKA